MLEILLLLIPIEVWMDIFDYLKPHNEKLVVKFNNLGDRRFSEICQHWLHEYPKNRCLSSVTISSYFNVNHRFSMRDSYSDNETDISNIPANLTSFKHIEIEQFGPQIVRFFRLGQQLNFTGVHIYLRGKSWRPHISPRRKAIALRALLPYLNDVKSFTAHNKRGLAVIRDHIHNHPSFLASELLILLFRNLSQQNYMELIIKWINIPRPITQYKYCTLALNSEIDIFMKAVVQQFLSAVSPVSFIIRILSWTDQEEEAEDTIILENKLKEKMMLQKIHEDYLFFISRGPTVQEQTYETDIVKALKPTTRQIEFSF